MTPKIEKGSLYVHYGFTGLVLYGRDAETGRMVVLGDMSERLEDVDVKRLNAHVTVRTYDPNAEDWLLSMDFDFDIVAPKEVVDA